MLWDGAALPRLDLHRARLARSSLALGWGLAALKLPDALPTEPARLRFSVEAAGEADWQIAALPPAKPLWRLGFSAERVQSGDPALAVKSTKRGLYDAARAGMPEGLDELLFLNERGEVTEGTITNLFFDRGQGLRTPPLTCGLLPGVLRAELGCPEEVLLPEDLPKVRLWVGNALRGLMPAVWSS
ncbi:aminotransferase class IV [Xinfangfangia sp. CPCC 101601]|uniref:Aminotransferase class IV n=2 Tax=Pseudogemmobacter lacusdianii TaxID=3069608 RepID=A0ABU0VUY9_9RHOB|nr:aminotransferase class IV [Xinfangfangia sp. CPCC 101601]MDQ2064800.1 aminotransferase class IV [Xinfangfangia sp. CPCC 101601]